MTSAEKRKLSEHALIPIHHDGKPRILYMITCGDRGGAQVHVRDLACAMQQEFEVAIVTGDEGFLTESCREMAIPVHIVPHMLRQVYLPADARALWEIHRLIRRLQPDLIHTHTFKAGFLGRLAAGMCRVPSIHTVHTWLFGTPALPRLWSVLGAPCERFAARRSQRLISVSEAGEHIARKYRIARPDKILTIHNGMPDCSKCANLAHDHVPVVTMVARFTISKDHQLLLKAFAAVPPGPRLRLIGDGPLRETCEKLAEQLGIRDRVEFLGYRDDVASLLASSDAFVLASKFEMFSLSILEAMRAGLPVIAFDIGGNRGAIVDGETGFLVPNGDVTALTKALSMVLSNRDLRVRFGRAARHRFEERFLFAHQERLTRNLYREVLFECDRVALSSSQRAPALTGNAGQEEQEEAA